MTDTPRGPNDPEPETRGWWIAGKWYPSEGAPASSNPESSPTPPTGAADSPRPAPPDPWAYSPTQPTGPLQPARGPSPIAIGIGIAAAVVVLVLAAVAGVLALGHTSAKKFPTTGTAVPAAHASGAPSGYTAFVDHTDRFSIAVPSAWREIDPTSPGASQTFQSLARANPKLAPILQRTLASKEIKFFAIQVNPAGASPNVNVGAAPAVGGRDQDLPDLLTSLNGTYARLGFTVVRTDYVPLAGHRALELTVSGPFASPNGTTTVVQETQYFVAANDLLYTVTLSGTSPEFATIASTFRVQ